MEFYRSGAVLRAPEPEWQLRKQSDLIVTYESWLPHQDTIPRLSAEQNDLISREEPFLSGVVKTLALDMDLTPILRAEMISICQIRSAFQWMVDASDESASFELRMTLEEFDRSFSARFLTALDPELVSARLAKAPRGTPGGRRYRNTTRGIRTTKPGRSKLPV